MDFIRWHALSSYVRWVELLESHQCKVIQFHHNLDNVEFSWAKENNFSPVSKYKTFEIGLEKIKRFEPDVLYCSAPLLYTSNSFIQNLLKILNKRPKLIAWYGANCGKEEIFQFFDLTLSNSKHLVSRLKMKKIPAEFLQHSFEPAVLDKIKIPEKRINKLGFFGSLDTYTPDFKERNKLLLKISDIGNVLQVHGTLHKPNPVERIKYSAIKSRHSFSRTISELMPFEILQKWAKSENLPPSPWPFEKTFYQKVKPPLFGHQMLQGLSNYQIAFNHHNKHTGDNACNMRLFEATGIGSCLLTDHKSDIHSIFEPDAEIVTYSSTEEAISKAKYLLTEPKRAQEIAIAGQKRTLSDYTTKKQIDHLVYYLKTLWN